MKHRHLEHVGTDNYSLAAIDDVILRGKWSDWAELRRAVLADEAVARKVAKVCGAHSEDKYAQRHQFWRHYVESKQVAA